MYDNFSYMAMPQIKYVSDTQTGISFGKGFRAKNNKISGGNGNEIFCEYSKKTKLKTSRDQNLPSFKT